MHCVRVAELQHFRVTLRDDSIAHLQRRGPEYRTVSEVRTAYDDFLKVVDDWVFETRIRGGHLGTAVRSRFGWLYDLREAPQQRNDDSFEAVIRELRPSLLKRSPFLCLLVRTATGRMQISRLIKGTDGAIHIASEEDAALAWLRQQLAPATTSTV